jgi:hypothetical protein
MRAASLVRLSLSAVALVATLPSVAAAQWVNTGSVASAFDPVWSVRWRPLAGSTAITQGSAANAAVMSGIPGVWNPNLPDARWISAVSSGSLAPGDNTIKVEYLFQTTFVATTEAITGMLGWDNQFMGAYLGGTIDSNGELIGGTQLLAPFTAPVGQGTYGFCRDGDGFLPGSSYPNCTLAFILSGLTIGQSATITLVLHGDGGTDGIFMTGASEVVVPEPAQASMLLAGLFGLGLVARRRRMV